MEKWFPAFSEERDMGLEALGGSGGDCHILSQDLRLMQRLSSFPALPGDMAGLSGVSSCCPPPSPACVQLADTGSLSPCWS